MSNFDAMNGMLKWLYYSTYHPCPGIHFQNAQRDFHKGMSIPEIEKMIEEGTYETVPDPFPELIFVSKKAHDEGGADEE